MPISLVACFHKVHIVFALFLALALISMQNQSIAMFVMRAMKYTDRHRFYNGLFYFSPGNYWQLTDEKSKSKLRFLSHGTVHSLAETVLASFSHN